MQQTRSFNFLLGSIPVRIHPSFLVVTAMLGATGDQTLVGLLQWVAVVFIGVLLHELGHALVGRTFGLSPLIDLQGMGGLTSWRDGRGELKTLKSIAISLAGPFTGIGIGALAWGYREAHWGSLSRAQGSLLHDIIWVNLFWGVLNLLPILPLDGGSVLHRILRAAMGSRGARAARIGSIVCCVLLAYPAFFYLGPFSLLMLAYFAFFNYKALRDTPAV